MKAREALYGPNLGYVLELYERYQRDPNSVDAPTRAFFDQISSQGDGWHALATLARPSTSSTMDREVNGAKPILKEEPPPVSGNGAAAQPPSVLTRPEAGLDTNALNRIVRAARLARGIREYGHLAAKIDPLGAPGPGDPMLEPATHGISDQDLAALPASIVWPSAGPEAGTCLDALRRLREIYCGSIGYEFDHVQDFA